MGAEAELPALQTSVLMGRPLLGSLALTLHRALSSRRDSRLPEVTRRWWGEQSKRGPVPAATVLVPPAGTGDSPGLGGQKDLEAAALRGPARRQRADTEGQQQPAHLPLNRMKESGAVVPEMVLINPLAGGLIEVCVPRFRTLPTACQLPGRICKFLFTSPSVPSPLVNQNNVGASHPLSLLPPRSNSASRHPYLPCLSVQAEKRKVRAA